MKEPTMNVNATSAATSTSLQTGTGSNTNPVDFQAILENSKQKLETGNSKDNSTRPNTSLSASTSKEMTPAEELAEWLKKTPAQHMRDAILKEMGLTEEEVAAMPPDKRAAVEASITEKIRERMEAQNAKDHHRAESTLAMLTRLATGQTTQAEKSAGSVASTQADPTHKNSLFE